MPENIQKRIIDELLEFLSPVSGAAESEEDLQRFFRQLGWNVEADSGLPLAPVLTAAGAIAHAIENLAAALQSSGMNDLSDFTSLLDDVKTIAASVQNLVSHFQSAGGLSTADLEEAATDLIRYLLATYLNKKLPVLAAAFRLIEVVRTKKSEETRYTAAGKLVRFPYAFEVIDFGKLGAFLSNPVNAVKDIYVTPYDLDTAAGADAFTDKLFPRLGMLVLALGGKAVYGHRENYNVDFGAAGNSIVGNMLSLHWQTPLQELNLGATLAYSPQELGGLGWLIAPFGTFAIEKEFNQFYFRLRAAAMAGLIAFGRNGVSYQGGTGFNIDLAVMKLPEGTSDASYTFGEPNGTRLELGSIGIGGNFGLQSGKPDFDIHLDIQRGKLVIAPKGQDSFISRLIPAHGIQIDFDFLIGYSTQRRFYIGGNAALEWKIPVHIDLAGVLKIDFINLLMGVKAEGITAEATTSGRAKLGPIGAAVEEIGLRATLNWNAPVKNLGFANLEFKFKPPKGIGLSVDAGLVKGAGYLFLDPGKGEYAGALELKIKNTIQVGAIGIINTKLPDGSQGFSLLIILSVQFTPGIALGLGFFLSGLGGMLGINRTINVPALQEGVRNNTLDSILFPENIIENITTILPQIKSVFPIQKDQFFIGLMAKITWGVPALVSIEFGIAIEFANPVRLTILGVLKVVLPTEKAAILKLQVNFVGIIDFDNGFLSFDASLVNSRILTFTLEGDMAIRLSWGRNKGFLMSAGGFHPAFAPPPELKVPALKRMTLNILSGNPSLVLTCYFAITSNTVQFGARADLKFAIKSFRIEGYLAFDAIFQFSPFRFEVSMSAGLAVKHGSRTLMCIRLDFTLSGPTPWNARGTASFSILFITVKVRFNITWGRAEQIIEPSIPVLPRALEAFSLPANWSAELPPNRSNLVSVNEMKNTAGSIVLQPFGVLRISQSVLPLNIVISKFGSNTPQDIRELRVSAVRMGNTSLSFSEVRDAFAPAAFRKMSDQEKLQSPSYTQEVSGARAADGSTIKTLYGVRRQLAYDCRISDFGASPAPLPGYATVSGEIFRKMAAGGDIGKSALSKENKSRLKAKPGGSVMMEEEQYVMVNNKTLARYAASGFSGGTRSEAENALQKIILANPALAGTISVAPEYSLG